MSFRCLGGFTSRVAASACFRWRMWSLQRVRLVVGLAPVRRSFSGSCGPRSSSSMGHGVNCLGLSSSPSSGASSLLDGSPSRWSCVAGNTGGEIGRLRVDANMRLNGTLTSAFSRRPSAAADASVRLPQQHTWALRVDISDEVCSTVTFRPLHCRGGTPESLRGGRRCGLSFWVPEHWDRSSLAT